jgi:transposase-like protein
MLFLCAMEMRMAKDNKTFGAADQAVVVKALLGGATVKEAAKAAGFCPQTLHKYRRRLPVFAEAWAAAVEESGRPMLVAPRGGRRWQAQRMRRNRFTPARKEVFLEHFAATCDATASAAVAEVSESSVYAHRRSDPAFAAGWQEALEQGYARLEAEAVAQRIKAMAALKVRLGKVVEHGDADAAAEFDRVLQLLREHKRGLAGAAKAGFQPTKWSFEDAFQALEKRLKVFGLRIERGEEAPDD